LESEQWLKFNDGFDGYGLAVIDNDVYSDGCECYNGLSEYEDGSGYGESIAGCECRSGYNAL
jgi:hypothetical protein